MLKNRKLYLFEVKIQCEYAIRSREKVNSIEWVDASDKFFYIHAFVSHVGNTSKLIWPATDNKTAQERGKELRKLLQLEDLHFLADRKLRNHLEHFDDRIDRLAEDLLHGRFYFDQVVGDREEFEKRTIVEKYVNRHFDPKSDKYIFQGQEYDLRMMFNCCVDIYGRTLRALDFPFIPLTAL